MKLRCLYVVLCFFTISLKAQQIELKDWKIRFGNFDVNIIELPKESEWQKIQTGIIWELQGYENIDGYAVYKTSIFIDSNIAQKAMKYNGLQLEIPKIDDADEVYFNFEPVGHTGNLPPNYVSGLETFRTYHIPYTMLKKNCYNLLIVKVFDGGGGGGISSQPELRIRSKIDEISIKVKESNADHVYKNVTKNQDFELSFSIDSKITSPANLTVHLINDFGDTLQTLQKSLLIKVELKDTIVILNKLISGIYNVMIQLKIEGVSKNINHLIAIEPEQILSQNFNQKSFTKYWDKKKRMLTNYPKKFAMKNIDSLSNDRIQVYEISTHSIDGHILKAWYVKPRTFQKMGAIVKYGSYTESTQPELYTSDKYAFLTVDIRGHGKSKVESDRGFPGYLTDGVENKNTYIYKWAYWDAALFLDFIYTQHPQIDTNNIHLVGHSQGATLCVAAASLSNHTVKSCMLSAIFFADLANQFKLSGWPKVEFEDYSKLSKYPMKKIERNLSYFDIKNMANMLNTNVMLAFGLKDHVCNARICFAFFNQLKCPKSYILYPASGHSLPPEYELEKWNWLNKFTKNIKP